VERGDMEPYKISYKWKLSDLDRVEKNGLKVFSCFSCGGGSTMGYKLAGMTVIGANEIDPEMAWHYKENHKPKHYYLEDIRKFRLREDLPRELYDLDILDGSPPCSSFSMAGSREKGWGKKKQFREGQVEQVLDDLFFDFIELARKLQPKVVVAENVKGMLQGNAKGYVKQIIGLFGVAGYDVQLFLLNAASMGVPQKRERVFFICSRKDLKKPKLKIGFNGKPILAKEILQDKAEGKKISEKNLKLWNWCKLKQRRDFGEAHTVLFGRRSSFNHRYTTTSDVVDTITSSAMLTHYKYPRYLNDEELSLIGSYPLDYNHRGSLAYMIGMSVPPLMTYGVANEIKKQWFNNGNA
jgi:DNA (cytosine-5)-methyltransferase 1